MLPQVSPYRITYILTYPEWHIVNAYDDYAKVIQLGDPHDYEYLKSISGFWSSLCTLSKKSASHGGFDFETKQTIYSIGVSFSANFYSKVCMKKHLGVYQHGYVAINIVG